jgi:hypothetical protein
MRGIYYGISGKASAGGQHVNEQHVVALRRMGLRAYLLYWPAGTTVERFDSAAPVVLLTPHMTWHPEDVMVLPEGWRRPLAEFGKVSSRKVLHCQNPYYVFHGVDQVSDYEQLGIERAIVCSDFTGRHLGQLGFRPPVHVVRPLLHPAFIAGRAASEDIESPGAFGLATGAVTSDTVVNANRPKRALQIAYMPRKLPVESRYLQGLFKAMYPQYRDVPWVAIEGRSHAECATLLRGSAVFAAFSYMEGLGLPPLEAMSCGCIVAGFHGHGGTEYATDGNGFWVEPGDHEGFVHAVARAIVTARDNGARRTIETQMANTIKAYSAQAFAQSISETWRLILGAQRDRFLLDPN